MAKCIECNLCDHPGTFQNARDIAHVPCNVRRFKGDVFTLWRCTGCGSIHCAEDADLSKYYARYPLKHHKLTYYERVAYKNRLRLLERHGFRRSMELLDFGCGVGLFVDFLRKSGLTRVFGYDEFVERYKQAPRLSEYFDAVVSYDAIERADDPRAFMKTAAKRVRQGGLLAIGTPRADGLSLSNIGDPALHQPYHRHILSEAMLVALGREQGFEPVHISRRSPSDSLVPFVNSRFSCRYIQATGGFCDAVVEAPRPGLLLRSPSLALLAFFGYFVQRQDHMVVLFKKT